MNLKQKFIYKFRLILEEILYHDMINSTSISIPKSAKITKSRLIGNIIIGERSTITSCELNGNIIIGNNTSINGPNTDIHSKVNTVKIGSFCSIARNVSIQEYNHIFKNASSYFIKHHIFGESWINEIESKGDIEIGNDVWIGTQCIILSGSRIGNGAVIGANSVVIGEIPPYSIAVGSPAKVQSFRFTDDIIDKLEQIKWWDWPIHKIKSNYIFFKGELSLDKFDNIV